MIPKSTEACSLNSVIQIPINATPPPQGVPLPQMHNAAKVRNRLPAKATSRLPAKITDGGEQLLQEMGGPMAIRWFGDHVAEPWFELARFSIIAQQSAVDLQ